MINDISAKKGGALTIFKDFIRYINSSLEAEKFNWYVLSSLKQKDLIKGNLKENIKIISCLQAGNNFLNKIIFDQIKIKKIIQKHKIDILFSMQNICTISSNLPQMVYFHQSKPFANFNTSIRDYNFYLKKYLYRLLIRFSFPKADKIFVQTNWIKQKIIEMFNIPSNKIKICRPKLDLKLTDSFNELTLNKYNLFYPTTGTEYKNIEVLIKALSIFMNKSNYRFKLYLTIKKDENYYCKYLYKLSNNLGINDLVKFIGRIKYEDVIKMYKKNILVFPSKLETLGLPLLEAASKGTYILAADLPYAREVLQGYNRVDFFNPNSPEMLADKILNLGNKSISKCSVEWPIMLKDNKKIGWKKVIEEIIKLERLIKL